MLCSEGYEVKGVDPLDRGIEMKMQSLMRLSSREEEVGFWAGRSFLSLIRSFRSPHISYPRVNGH